jgi:hypothetical protein
MSALRRAAAIGLGLLLGLTARAEDTTDLDAVNTGETRSLDDFESGESRDLDAADAGGTDSLDSVDTGETDDLDSADKGSTDDLDAVDTGKAVDLDTAETGVPAPVAAPAPVPDIESAAERAEALRIHEEAVAATQELNAANAAYSEMMARGYPTGDARARIIQQRDTARAAHTQANARYQDLLKKLSQRGNPN